ncbi:hypothetical protein CLOSTMETH_01656 [[Clostridium] methylpentosum DSM 5476]|uniref:Uncharacterized protein n=1 Tax=[Clostridium] methylpentosum DSM 5476 TaxID=537013 RepID=C0ECT5_9FIRM|nr:hypothetical protein CLOSTMETH_01656 [[Clostridium] methylpentosum DSM 5476]
MAQKEARKNSVEQDGGRQKRQRRFRAIFSAELVSLYSPIAPG